MARVKNKAFTLCDQMKTHTNITEFIFIFKKKKIILYNFFDIVLYSLYKFYYQTLGI